MADLTEAKLEANVATWQKYVDNLFAALERKLTPARRAAIEAKLAHYLDTLARNQRALTAYRENPDVPPVTPIPISPSPLPNNAQPRPPDLFYECPADFDAAAFEAKYGADVQTILSRVVTAILRPDLSKFQRLVNPATGYTQTMANRDMAGWQAKQRSVMAYFAGEVSFETGVMSYLGPTWSQYLGCVDIAAIHDLGA
jgi:hypothetical protein